jgi:CHAT domain-containing protein
MPVRHAAAVTLAAACALTTFAAAPQAQRPDAFATCRDRFVRAPDDYESAYCFYEVTFRERLWEDGSREFARLIAAHPDNFWLPMAYGHVYRERDAARAEALYRHAAGGFQDAGHAEGEILARSNLRNFLFPKAGRVADAEREMRRVREIGAGAGDPLLRARAWILEATHTTESGADLGVAYRLLKQAAALVFPSGPYRLKRTCLISLGNVALRLGRIDEARATYTALEQLAAAEGEMLVQATARYNILTSATLKHRLLPGPDAARELLAIAERSLDTAVAAQNYDITLKTHLAIAELQASRPDARPAARAHAARCLALAVKLAHADDEALCAWMMASLLRGDDPRGALDAERQAMAAGARASSPATHAFAAGQRMRLVWDLHPRERAIDDSLLALDAIETLRDLQDDTVSSAELFSTWTPHYYWLSGRLLQDGRDGLDLALTITERMRARGLLDSLDRAEAGVERAASPDERRLRETISAVQRRLLDPSLAADERAQGLAELERLEFEDAEARRLRSVAARGVSPARPSFASIDALQSALGANEALLSFQVGLWDALEGGSGGGSWLIVVTRDSRSAHRIPDRAQLAPLIPVFSGLLARSDGLDRTAAARLYHDLLADALAALPPIVDRLIVVADGPLHHLPFEALRPAPAAAPLATRYQFVVAPSATLWLQSRMSGQQAIAGRALVLADPAVAHARNATAAVRNATLESGIRAGALPYSRHESRAIARHLGAADTLVGEAASERALKNVDLRRYAIVHLAAHAVADEARPHRSAVLLASPDEREDGLLQAAEIERLDLDRRIVVLSACQTAAGAVLSGEGVLSLARAFFAAGATSVIGTRWPVRDADAAFLFDAFYRALAGGDTLAAAVQRARLAALDAGRPPMVWASLVLLGEGEVRLEPPPRTADWTRRATAVLIGAIVLAMAVAMTTKGHETRQRHVRRGGAVRSARVTPGDTPRPGDC